MYIQCIYTTNCSAIRTDSTIVPSGVIAGGHCGLEIDSGTVLVVPSIRHLTTYHLILHSLAHLLYIHKLYVPRKRHYDIVTNVRPQSGLIVRRPLRRHVGMMKILNVVLQQLCG